MVFRASYCGYVRKKAWTSFIWRDQRLAGWLTILLREEACHLVEQLSINHEYWISSVEPFGWMDATQLIVRRRNILKDKPQFISSEYDWAQSTNNNVWMDGWMDICTFYIFSISGPSLSLCLWIHTKVHGWCPQFIFTALNTPTDQLDFARSTLFVPKRES